MLTNASGGIVAGADTRYYPFGERRFSTSAMVTDKLFTGQRQIAELGIYHYGARFYSPKLGRFLSADTIVPGYANPQNLNRFSYTLNNPLRYIDPTGHKACEDSDGQGSCLSEKEATKKSKAELRRLREEARRRKEEKESDSGGHPLLSPTNGDINVGGGHPLTSVVHDDPPPWLPQYCNWTDCILSLVSIGASGVITAFPEVPPAVATAFVVDAVVTYVAVGRTNQDYAAGKITQTRQWFLNGTAIIGALPIPVVGLGLSIINGMSTAVGWPP